MGAGAVRRAAQKSVAASTPRGSLSQQRTHNVNAPSPPPPAPPPGPSPQSSTPPTPLQPTPPASSASPFQATTESDRLRLHLRRCFRRHGSLGRHGAARRPPSRRASPHAKGSCGGAPSK
eukprot:350140-Chlamydomonas_euryale.AAC.1